MQDELTEDYRDMIYADTAARDRERGARRFCASGD